MKKPIFAIVLAVAAAGAVLVLDPVGWYTFKFDDTDMRAAVEGTWEVNVGEGAQARTYQLAISQSGSAEQHSQRGLVSPASACGNRSFVRNAGACLDTSQMMLHVDVLGVSPPPHAWGELHVNGLHFKKGWFRIEVGDVHDRLVDVSATIEPDGTVVSIDGYGQPGKHATLRRIAAETPRTSP